MHTSNFNKSWLRPLYNDIHTACYQFTSLVGEMQWNFDRILGVSRGGLLPAMIVSHMLKLPMTPISYSSKHGRGDNRNHANELPIVDGSTLLLIDDICDSGETLREVRQHYLREGHAVYTFALYYKHFTPPTFTPDFKWRTIPPDAGWVIFPYEVEGPWNTINDEDLNAPNAMNNKANV